MTHVSRSTQAAVLVRTGEPLRLTELNLPQTAPGQVVVDISYSGVCRSQLLEVRGERGPDRFLPHTLGHEASGVVLETGPGVSKVQVGDRVVLSWIKGRGADVPSTQYTSAAGLVNSGPISTFMQRTVVSENRVTRVSSDTPMREAALLGCALPTGVGALLKCARATAGSSVVVFGAGGVGLSAILAASLVQAAPIVAVDVVDAKLEQARAAGATHTVNAARVDSISAILEITAGRGADYAIEAAGRRETMELALRVVRERGGLAVVAGNLPSGQTIAVDPYELIKGKRLAGTWGGDCDPDEDIPWLAELCRAGHVDLSTLLGATYALADINQALADLEAGRVARALVEM